MFGGFHFSLTSRDRNAVFIQGYKHGMFLLVSKFPNSVRTHSVDTLVRTDMGLKAGLSANLIRLVVAFTRKRKLLSFFEQMYGFKLSTLFLPSL